MGISFSSAGEYFRFIGAKEFVNCDKGDTFDYPTNALEKIGNALSKPVLATTDLGLRNIRNPLVITAITIAVIALITLVFYPVTVAGVIAFSIQPWVLKLSFYLIAQITTLGIGLRALGRLNNNAIAVAWNAKTILPIQIGSERL